MIIENEDFIQYNLGKKKLFGFIQRDKVMTSEGEQIEVNNAINPEESNLINVDAIITNYGKEPDFESLKIEVFNSTYVVPLFGSVTEYRPISEVERKVIKDSLAEMKEDCEKFTIFPTRINIKINKGKKVGYYKYNKKEDVNEISLMPVAFDKENTKSILYHEVAHAVWENMVPEDVKVKWVRLYDKNMERKKVKSQEIINLRSDLINSGMRISEYIKNMEDGETMKKVAEYIKDLYNLKPQHIDLLVQQGDDLLGYWPKDGIELSEYTPFVSEYATESVEEFFAESFMFYYMKADLPAIVEKAIKYTLNKIGVI